MSAKAKSKLTPEQQKATMTRVLQKIKPYGFFVVCSLIVAAVSVAAQLYIPILCGSAIDMRSSWWLLSPPLRSGC